MDRVILPIFAMGLTIALLGLGGMVALPYFGQPDEVAASLVGVGTLGMIAAVLVGVWTDVYTACKRRD